MTRLLLHGDSLSALPIKADCLITSPPYFNHIVYNNRVPPYSCKRSYSNWLKEFFDLAKKSSDLLIIIHQRHFEDIIGVKADQKIVIKKQFPEYAYVFGSQRYEPEIKARAPSHRDHPCPFDENMIQQLLEPLPRWYSILDPFAGVGTTLKVAQRMRFSSVIGIEKEQVYVAKSGLRSIGFSIMDIR